MGELRKKMPVTFWTFVTGTLALAGFWPLSGFFSKDSILAQALRHSNPSLKYGCFTIGVLVTALTAFYMFRLVFVVFFGPAKSEAAGHVTEPPSIILWPLRILAVFSVVGGVIGIDSLYARHFNGGGVEGQYTWWQQLSLPFTSSPLAAIAGLLAAAIGSIAAYSLYFKAIKDPLPEKLGAFSRAMRNRFYFDELYEATAIRLHELLAAIAGWFDRWIIAGLVVRGTHGTTELAGRALRLLQTGNLQTYAFLFALGVALLLYFAL
jgi:NADH-quinone oxidoreductase subunit L